MENIDSECVQLDGLVLLKIIKHCRQNLPDAVSGNLLGLDVKEKLEVTGCFPMPAAAASSSKAAKQETDTEEYQMAMMKLLREVNADANTVGWYQSISCGDMMQDMSGASTWSAIIEAQFEYQRSIPRTVVIVYDPIRTTHGSLAIKAYRLTPSFMNLYATRDFTRDSFARHQVSSEDIFQEIPLKVHNSHLVHAFLYELRESGNVGCDFERLNMNQHSMITNDLNSLGDAIHEYSQEQGRYQFYQRSVARQKLQQESIIAKRSAGTSDKATEDAAKTAFKKIPMPPRLDTFLISHQIRQFCDQLASNTNQGFSRLYATQGIVSQLQVEEETAEN